jgi:hypothetical protein
MTFYRKKKRKPGPSKNEEKVRRGQAAADNASSAGTLAGRLSFVRSLTLKMTVTSPQGVVLSEENKKIGPNDPFLIEADCSGSCGSGSFDFSEGVAEALSRRQASGLVEFPCAEPSYSGGASAVCGCVARCAYQAELSA